MIRVAILGASGFIGSRAVELFTLTNAAKIRAIVRSYSSLPSVARFDLDFRVCDARDRAGLQKAFNDCDVVVHAVLGNPDVIEGTIEPVYSAAQAAGVRRLIYLSSASVHGQAPPVGTDEDSRLSLAQPFAYNRAKVKAEMKLQSLRAAGSTEIVILRPGIVYGPRSRWIVEIANDLITNNACLINNGQGICNCMYVDNLLDAMQLTFAAKEIDGQIFLVGDKEEVSWFDFYSSIALALNISTSQIHNIPMPEFKEVKEDAVTIIRRWQLFQGVAPYISPRLKMAVKAGLKTLTSSFESPWVLSDKWEPTLTQEMAQLQSCSYKLPLTKAATRLGYLPETSFTRGMQRSTQWLAFAGYPVEV